MTESDAIQFLLLNPDGPFPDEVWQHIAELFVPTPPHQRGITVLADIPSGA